MLIFSLLCCRWQETKEWVDPCLPACLGGARANPSCPRSTTFSTRNTACTQPLCNGLPNTSMPTKCAHTPLPGFECRNAHFTPTWFSVMSSIKVHQSELLMPSVISLIPIIQNSFLITSAYKMYQIKTAALDCLIQPVRFLNAIHQNQCVFEFN